MIFGVCMAVTYGYRGLPLLNAGDADGYRFFRGLEWFLLMLPAILLSGFTVACSVHWQGVHGNGRRFTQAQFDRFKGVVLVSIGIVFFCAFNHEVFAPMAKNRLADYRSGPAELQFAKGTAHDLLEAGQPEFAYQYAKRAVEISRKDAEAQALLTFVEDEMKLARDKVRQEKRELETVDSKKLISSADMSYSVRELVEKAKACADNSDWFNAHYWASLAVAGCSGTDGNLSQAAALANQAWNALHNPSGFDNEAELDYYNRKMEAYQSLQAGATSDIVKAYYDFLELQSYPGRISEDPDVTRFLELAREALANDYFFIDETDLMEQLENSRNVYFALDNPIEKTRSVFYARGVMDTKLDGRSVRYLDGLSLVTCSEQGKFVRSVYAPIAKVVATPVKMLPESVQEAVGARKSWGQIPVLMLQAVDRKTRGIVSLPKYSYQESGVSLDVLKIAGFSQAEEPKDLSYMRQLESELLGESNTMLLSMPYSDFVLLKDASGGPDKMNLIALHNFVKKAKSYGFSYEVFIKNLVCRGLYPFFILILCIIAATMGWNYRIDGEKVNFKFRWLFLVPLYGVVTYLVIDVATYFYEVVNYVMVGFFPSWVVWVCLVLYLLIFAGVSVNFLARHDH